MCSGNLYWTYMTKYDVHMTLCFSASVCARRPHLTMTGPAQRHGYIIMHLKLHHVTSSKLKVPVMALWIPLRPLHTFDASLSRARKKNVLYKVPCTLVHRLASLRWYTGRASTVESCVSDTFFVNELFFSLSFDVTFLVLLPQKH
jgi:hypothetical protein